MMKKKVFAICILLILSGCSNGNKTFSSEISNEKLAFANVFLSHENIGKKILEFEHKDYLDFLSSIDADYINKSDYDETVGQYYYFEFVLKSGKIIRYSGDSYIFVNDNIFKINNIDYVREKADTIVKIQFGR